MLRLCSLYTHFGKSFYREWMLNFVKCFFWVYWNDHVVFVFSFIYVVYHIDWFVYVEPSLWTWDESHLVVVYGLFLCIVGFGLLIFVEIFCIYIGLSFLFWWCLCLVLVSGWWWLHRMYLGVFLFNFLEEFEKDRYKFFFVCLAELAIWSWTSVCREFLFLFILKIIFTYLFGCLGS